jgi:hypothetical protein
MGLWIIQLPPLHQKDSADLPAPAGIIYLKEA